MNPYQVLGVSQTADEETIKKSYRLAAKECPPDSHPGDKRAEERFKEIGEAYRILCDKQKRKKYDARAAQKEQKVPESATGRKKEKCPQQKINPMDVTDLFERYMGFKR